MTVLASSWTGSFSPRVVSADATRIPSWDRNSSLLNVFILFQQITRVNVWAAKQAPRAKFGIGHKMQMLPMVDVLRI